ncbi:glycosyltransferase [Desulfitobacterium sp. Sab5]|uniref:glycosyltransferase n=1 Tax=Desulfitobacterium TaxID=36853 RepID=UPI003CE88A04
MPKLCLLANAASPHTEKWALELARRGWSVELISFLPAEIPGVKIHLVPKVIGRKIDFILRVRWVKEKVQELQPDILHAHYATSFGFLGAICSVHPFIISAWGSDIFSFPKQSLFHRLLLKWILGKADYLCSTSHIMAKEMDCYIKVSQKIEVIPFGVDIDQFSPQENLGSTSSRKVIFGVAKYLQPVYGLDILFESFARLNKLRPGQALLKIAGDGPELFRLKSLAARLGIDQYVEWLGAMPNSKIAQFYRDLDVVVVPSRQESFGVTAVEGSACARPIIASRVGGLPEVVIDRETGIMVEKENVSELTQAMKYFMDHPEERVRMGQAGREFVLRNYAWKENVTQMENVYRRVLQRSK